MTDNRRPYFSIVRISEWRDKITGQRTLGIRLSGAYGPIAAHLTAEEARNLADTLHDLADTLQAQQEPPQPPPAPRQTNVPLHTSYSVLTAADGTPEQPLPATIAD